MLDEEGKKSYNNLMKNLNEASTNLRGAWFFLTWTVYLWIEDSSLMIKIYILKRYTQTPKFISIYNNVKFYHSQFRRLDNQLLLNWLSIRISRN
jgi:uncharacterized protein Usg